MTKMTQGQISSMNKRFIDRRNRDIEEEEAAAQAAEIDARKRNSAQPKGKWDAGSQTWIPEDPTHGKASRKWNPGGVNPWSGAIDQQREDQESDMCGVALADQIGLRSSADDTFAAIQQETARRQPMANNVIGVVMSQARMRFGGQITPELANWANGILGADANSGMVGGGRQKDGSFVIKMADGSVIPFSVQSQIGMAYQMPGTSTDDDRAGLIKAGQLSGIPKNILAQLTRNPFDSQVIQKNAENIIRQRYLSKQEEGRRNILRRSKNPDSVRARGGLGDGSAGGRNIGSVDVPGNVARRLFGLGGDNRSRISFFGTSGRPGDGWSERVYDGHTGEDTGFVNFGGRREYELDREADRLSKIARERGAGRSGYGTGSGVEIARINAESREKVAGINNATKIDLAKLTDAQRRSISAAANELKKYGIDVGLQIAQEGNASKEKIAAQTEAGRNARFTMRNDREWEKLAQGWEKIDNDFAVRMRRADTYGKRVDILEQKLKNDYDIALKKAKTADERAKVEADYKDRMASVAEGNFDLNWFKAETAADQGQQKIDNDKAAKEEDRKLKLALAGISAGAKTTNGTVVGADDMKTAKYYIQLLDSGRLDGENRAKVKEWLNSRGLLGIDNQTTIKPGDNSGGKTVTG